jgi:hypothetical protein
MPHEGLAPGVERGNDARLRAKVLGGRQAGAQGVVDGLKQQRRHHRDVGQPQWVEGMREREDHVIMVTSEQPPLLAGEPALGLEIGALGTRPVATRVVPEARHVALGTGLHMAAKGRCPALHNGACGSADVRGQEMCLLIRGKGVLEDRLQGHEGHRGLRTR